MAAAVLSRVAAAAATAAAGAGMPADRPRPRVAVIGAGFAGLAAALTLQRSGHCDVVVLEASSRAGGRACTQALTGSTAHALEMGATWFHGLGTPEAPNPVFKHALEQRLIGIKPQGEKWWSSQFLLPGSTQPLSRQQQLGLTKALAAWSEVVEGLPADAQGTTAEHLAMAWDSLLASGQLSSAEQEEAAGLAWRWREHLQRAMDGCDSTWEQSAQGLALYDEMPGGVHCALPAGMQTVAEGLATQLADLRYGHAVQRISWGPSRHSGPSSASMHSGSGSGSSRHSGVTIACADGTQIQADAAVVTVSLGVLKAQHEQLFDPPLPPEKADAIQRLRIGTVDKVFLDFSPAGAAGEGGDVVAAGGKGHSQEAVEGAGEVAAVAGSSAVEPPVSFALLWSDPWQEGGGSCSSGDQPAAAAAGSAAEAAVAAAAVAAAGTAAALADGRGEANVPGWARGIFSLRFGGPEVKLLPQQPAQQPIESSSIGVQPQPQRTQHQHQQPEQQQEQPAAVLAATPVVEEEGGTDEAEFNPCAEASQPSCYQAVAWLTGEAAAAMEAASEEEVLCTLRQLALLFPQMQLPPGASWDAVQLYHSCWGSDPLTRGSYSYLGPHSSPADVATLAAPLYTRTSTAATPGSSSGTSPGNGGKGSDAGGSGGKESGAGTASDSGAPPVLLFAGEACHVKYIGTMHGAYMTGQQAAECLVEHWRYQEEEEEALRG